MVTPDRIRLTGLLRKSPASRGFSMRRSVRTPEISRGSNPCPPPVRSGSVRQRMEPHRRSRRRPMTAAAPAPRNTPLLARLTRVTSRYRWPVIALWIVLTLFGGVAAGKLSTRWYQGLSIPGKPAYEASVRTLKTLGVGTRPPNVVVFHTSGDATKSKAIEHAMQRAAATMPDARTSSYFSTGSSMYVSRDRHTIFE